MKTRYLLVALWLLVALARTAYPSPLTEAVRQVESAGNDRAVSDQGRSRGPMQCQRATWREACEYGRVTWDYNADVWDREKSAQVFRWYGQRYGAKTDEQFCRIWNGGPGGMRKRATVGYWKRVAGILASEAKR